MHGLAANTPERRTDFVFFLRARKDDILAEWEKAARENPRAAEMDRPQLLNARALEESEQKFEATFRLLP